MEKIRLIESLLSEMIAQPVDLKIEPQIFLAIYRGIFPDDLVVSCNNLFHREYSRDLYSATVDEDGKKQPVLHLQLTRAGIYDHLPEGLFFQLPQGTSSATSDAVMKYKENKKREEEIRRFFLPYENEIFRQRLNLEEEENALLQGLQSGILNEYFVEFWKLSDRIPRQMLVPLIMLLPYANRISGNTELCSECLSYLLNEEVEIRRRTRIVKQAVEEDMTCLGDAILGLDSVCGSLFFEDQSLLEISIGPLQNSSLLDYLDNGSRFVLIETFNRFFLPAGEDVDIEIRPNPEKEYLILDADEQNILGYSTALHSD